MITDPADPALDPFRNLTDAALRRSLEAADGLFIAESLEVVRRALLWVPALVRAVLLTPAAEARLAVELAGCAAPRYVADPAVLGAVAGFNVHRGVLAAMTRPPARAASAVLAAARRVAVLEDLTDQTNLGALFRSAWSLGMDAVLLSERCADPLYRRSVRVSMGEVLRVPWARLEPWPEALAQLHHHRFELWALTPAGAQDLAPPSSADQRVAVLIGSEADGLSAAAMAAATRAVRIPMRAGADSLNVAAAAAIAFSVLGQVGTPDQQGERRPATV
ncbi:MAG: TrmH family RNA methyltransferase [Acidimicrobiales bacterium]